MGVFKLRGEEGNGKQEEGLIGMAKWHRSKVAPFSPAFCLRRLMVKGKSKGLSGYLELRGKELKGLAEVLWTVDNGLLFSDCNNITE